MLLYLDTGFAGFVIHAEFVTRADFITHVHALNSLHAPVLLHTYTRRIRYMRQFYDTRTRGEFVTCASYYMQRPEGLNDFIYIWLGE